MLPKKKNHPKVKAELHPRNKHRKRYDFKQLIESYPDLSPFVKPNKYRDDSIDFFDAEAVRTLNQALLKHHYAIDHWNIPKGYLCPPIPGRADYLHHVADLLGGKPLQFSKKKIPMGSRIQCLDIGIGASCIYPIIGNREYGWSFIGTDTDRIALESAHEIISLNPSFTGQIELRFQRNPSDIFWGVLQEDEPIDVSICNPPFHASLEAAQAGTLRKLKNLKGKKIHKPVLNFGGQSNELWYEGGERTFVTNMIFQSRQFAASCFWFTTLISKESNLSHVYRALKKAKAVTVRTIQMGQGNKKSRIVAWTFLTSKQQKIWAEARF